MIYGKNMFTFRSYCQLVFKVIPPCTLSAMFSSCSITLLIVDILSIFFIVATLVSVAVFHCGFNMHVQIFSCFLAVGMVSFVIICVPMEKVPSTALTFVVFCPQLYFGLAILQSLVIL